eukprot:1370916-Amorphochlora_amoeboformis.AAC.1
MSERERREKRDSIRGREGRERRYVLMRVKGQRRIKMEKRRRSRRDRIEGGGGKEKRRGDLREGRRIVGEKEKRS